MRLFAREKPDLVLERRIGARMRVNCPATMVMPSGDRQGHIYDISSSGARFLTDDPPSEGSSAILDWTLHETGCKVIWSKEGMCGVEFDRPLRLSLIDDILRAAPARPRLVNRGRGTPDPEKPHDAPQQAPRFHC